MSKRKAEYYRHPRRDVSPPAPNQALFIQAHEADVVRGPRAHAAALALEVRIVDGQVVAGEGLIRWRGAADAPRGALGEEDAAEETGDEGGSVWVDRYDARLLLDTLPSAVKHTPARSASPSGWSDLPSDAEDTFFLAPSELAEYTRRKHQRTLEAGREARLAALRAESPSPPPAPEDAWGGSDEEPDEPQRELMRRTAVHLGASPNAAQLSMRILANHGADPRFAFLRGRWGRAWRLEQARVRVQQTEERRRREGVVAATATLGGLGDYGDSDEEEEPVQPVAESVSGPSDDAVKEARRARAREWAAQRKAAAADPGRDDSS